MSSSVCVRFSASLRPPGNTSTLSGGSNTDEGNGAKRKIIKQRRKRGDLPERKSKQLLGRDEMTSGAISLTIIIQMIFIFLVVLMISTILSWIVTPVVKHLSATLMCSGNDSVEFGFVPDIARRIEKPKAKSLSCATLVR